MLTEFTIIQHYFMQNGQPAKMENSTITHPAINLEEYALLTPFHKQYFIFYPLKILSHW